MAKALNVEPTLLDEYIEKSGLKLGHIIEKLGLSRASWHRKKNGSVPFRVSEVYVLCDLLKIPEEDQGKIFCIQVDKTED